MIYETLITNGARVCHGCRDKIPRRSKILVEYFGGAFNSYKNYCATCAVDKLKTETKETIKILNEFVKYLEWDK